MPPLSRPRGVCAATLTPLDADLGPDAPALIAHLERLFAAGCDAINLLGTTGEATSFSRDQRLKLMEDVAAAGLPLHAFMVGTGAAALADAVRLTRRAIELGYAGQLVIPPFYFKGIDDAGLFAFYAALIERVGDPRLRLYLYHFPAMSGVPIPLAVIARLRAAYPQTLAGVKDSANAPGYAAELVAAFPDLDVFPSTEAVLATARRDGFAGCISATVNVTAALAAAVWRAGDDDPERAQRQQQLAAQRAAIARFPLIPALRHLTARRTGDDGWRRIVPPLRPLDDAQAAALDAAFLVEAGA